MHTIMYGAGMISRQMVRFAWLQARCCAFAVALLGGMAASKLLPPLPAARYDLLLAYGVLLTAVGFLLGWETRREVAVVAVCHLLGLAFELVKVHVGSWNYPEPGLAKIAGVPLYGGFMYAAVGSYVCRSWRLLDLTLTGYRARSTAALAVGLYVNFLSHHWLPDLRWPLGGLLLVVTTGTWVSYTVGERRHRMPLVLSFALIGFFLWLAENVATYLGAWRYPSQIHGWEPVSVSKWVSWALLISVTFVLCEVGQDAPRSEECPHRRSQSRGRPSCVSVVQRVRRNGASSNSMAERRSFGGGRANGLVTLFKGTPAVLGGTSGSLCHDHRIRAGRHSCRGLRAGQQHGPRPGSGERQLLLRSAQGSRRRRWRLGRRRRSPGHRRLSAARCQVPAQENPPFRSSENGPMAHPL